jgi:hypothetical protein
MLYFVIGPLFMRKYSKSTEDFRKNSWWAFFGFLRDCSDRAHLGIWRSLYDKELPAKEFYEIYDEDKITPKGRKVARVHLFFWTILACCVLALLALSSVRQKVVASSMEEKRIAMEIAKRDEPTKVVRVKIPASAESGY